MKEIASMKGKKMANCNFQKERDIIIAIIGKSGSGKSEIVKRYYNQGINVIQSYTDRPERYSNEWGHIFIKTEEVENYREDMIAYTVFDKYHYFATRSQYRGKGITFYVIDPKGVTELKNMITDAELKFIFLCVDEDIRIERMVKRTLDKLEDTCEKEVQALYEAARNRAKYDREAFKVVQCDYVVDNNGEIGDTFQTLEEILKSI
jgi:guanylate kinase